MQAEAIDLTLPAGREWHAVARLVLGGVADRMNLSFEDLDDLQLAVERLLVEAASQETVQLRIDIVDHGVQGRRRPAGRAHDRRRACKGPTPRPAS